MCTVSAFSFVQGHDTLSFVLRTTAANSCLERCPCFLRTCSCGRRFCARVLLFVGVILGPLLDVWNPGPPILRNCRVDSRFDDNWHLSIDNCTSFEASGLGFQCSGVLRTFCLLSFLCVIHFVHGSGREKGCLPEHIESCVKTLHLRTVSVCLAWSSPLSRYCCCVDCLYCDLDT